MARHDQGIPIGQLPVSFDDNLGTRRQPLIDDHLLAHHASGLHGHVTSLAVLHQEYPHAIAPSDQPVLGNHDGVLREGARHIDRGDHPRLDPQLGVVALALDSEGARIPAAGRIDAGDFARQCTRLGGQAHLHLSSVRKCHHIAIGNRQHDLHRVEADQTQQRRCGCDHLTNFHVDVGHHA